MVLGKFRILFTSGGAMGFNARFTVLELLDIRVEASGPRGLFEI